MEHKKLLCFLIFRKIIVISVKRVNVLRLRSYQFVRCRFKNSDFEQIS